MGYERGHEGGSKNEAHKWFSKYNDHHYYDLRNTFMVIESQKPNMLQNFSILELCELG